MDRDDKLADFSSRGPRVGDDAIKPDLTAPGVDIVAAKGAGTELGTPVGEHYVTLSGTSMATPHVVGAVALLAQQHPDWSAAQFKATLMASAKPDPTLTAYQQGAGRVDVARAITQSVTTDPVSLSFGRASWPHADDEPVTRTVTYRNPGTAELTLELALQVSGPDGAAAPAGLFRTSADRVTVPAGGQAAVTVTADTRVASPDGYWSGRLSATAGSTLVTTPVGVHKEVESYDVTFTHLDQAGAPAAEYFTTLVGLDQFIILDVYDDDGTVTARVPKGRYGLNSVLFIPRGEQYDASMLTQPELTVTRDSTVTLDARQAKPVQVTVPERSAAPALIDIAANWTTEDAGFGVRPAELHVRRPQHRSGRRGNVGRRASAPRSAASGRSRARMTRFTNSPYLYALSELIPGRFPTGYVKHYRDRDLATVKHDFRGSAPGQTVLRPVFPVYAEPECVGDRIAGRRTGSAGRVPQHRR